jgi:hypothetical protein
VDHPVTPGKRYNRKTKLLRNIMLADRHNDVCFLVLGQWSG